MFSPGYGMPPGVKWTLIITVIAFIIHSTYYQLHEMMTLYPYNGYVDFYGRQHDFNPTQLLTYMLTHGGFGHIFFNMIALWVFGSQFERELGTQEFFSVYLFSGFVTGLSYTFFTNTPILGASAGVYGMMVAFAYFWPNAQLFIFGIFPLRAKILILILMGVGLLFATNPQAGDNTGHLGHLIGAVTAFIYLQLKYRRYTIKDLFS